MKGFISFLIVFVSVVGGYAIGYTHRGVICQSDVKIEKEQARYEQHFSDMPTVFVDKDGRREYMVDGKEFVDLKSYQTMQSAYELMSKINDANTALLNRQHKLITHLIALVRLASNNPATKHETDTQTLWTTNTSNGPTKKCNVGDKSGEWTCARYADTTVWIRVLPCYKNMTCRDVRQAGGEK